MAAAVTSAARRQRQDVAMTRAPNPRSVEQSRPERSGVGGDTTPTAFRWSRAKLRTAALVVGAVAAPAPLAFWVSGPIDRWLCIAWLVGLFVLLDGLGRRALQADVMLSVDQRGILDRRLMSRRLAWQEIDAICPANTTRSQTIDIRLRWPHTTLAGTRLLVRLGALCQSGYGVPAVTISMVLLDGSVAEVLEAVAQYRPDLLHHSNRGLPSVASPLQSD